jgi:hypothetical protein
VGLHQSETRARDRRRLLARVLARLLGRGEGTIREIDRMLELTTMALAPARHVQLGRLSELVGEDDRGLALKGARIERRRKVRHRRHGLSLPSKGRAV